MIELLTPRRAMTCPSPKRANELRMTTSPSPRKAMGLHTMTRPATRGRAPGIHPHPPFPPSHCLSAMRMMALVPCAKKGNNKLLAEESDCAAFTKEGDCNFTPLFE